jgi:hypothetical protein
MLVPAATGTAAEAGYGKGRLAVAGGIAQAGHTARPGADGATAAVFNRAYSIWQWGATGAAGQFSAPFVFGELTSSTSLGIVYRHEMWRCRKVVR